MKALALCTALGLGGGYVWQRQKTAADHDDASKRPKEAQRTVLPGSKSAWGSPPGGKMADEDGEAIEPPEVLESGLQDIGGMADEDFGSGEFVLPDEDGDEPAQEKTVLPGSKSIGRILPPPVKEKESNEKEP